MDKTYYHCRGEYGDTTQRRKKAPRVPVFASGVARISYEKETFPVVKANELYEKMVGFVNLAAEPSDKNTLKRFKHYAASLTQDEREILALHLHFILISHCDDSDDDVRDDLARAGALTLAGGDWATDTTGAFGHIFAAHKKAHPPPRAYSTLCEFISDPGMFGTKK